MAAPAVGVSFNFGPQQSMLKFTYRLRLESHSAPVFLHLGLLKPCDWSLSLLFSGSLPTVYPEHGYLLHSHPSPQCR